MKFGILLQNESKMRLVRHVFVWYFQLHDTQLFQLMQSFINKSPIETYKLNVVEYTLPVICTMLLNILS